MVFQSNYDPALQIFSTLTTAYLSPYAGIAFGYGTLNAYNAQFSSTSSTAGNQRSSVLSLNAGSGSSGFGLAANSFSGSINALNEQIKELREQIEDLVQSNKELIKSRTGSESKPTSLLTSAANIDQYLGYSDSKTQYEFRAVVYGASEQPPPSKTLLGTLVPPNANKQTQLEFEVTRSTSVGKETLEYRFIPYLSTTDADDFGVVPTGTVTFKDGERTAKFSIQASDDGIREQYETVVLGLYRPLSNSLIARAGGIIDNDRPYATGANAVVLGVDENQSNPGTPDSINDYNQMSLAEGDQFLLISAFDGDLYNEDVNIQFTLTGNGAVDILMDINVLNDMGSVVMFTTGTGPNDPDRIEVVVMLMAGDSLDDVSGLPLLELVDNPMSAAYAGTPSSIDIEITMVTNTNGDELGITSTGVNTVTVSDADSLLKARAPTSFEIDAGNNNQRQIYVTIDRLGSADGEVTVDYAIAGTPNTTDMDVDPDDFFVDDGMGMDDPTALPTGMLTFLDGETEKTVALTLTGDDIAEGDEMFVITLSNLNSVSGRSNFLSMDPPSEFTITDNSNIQIRPVLSTATERFAVHNPLHYAITGGDELAGQSVEVTLMIDPNAMLSNAHLNRIQLLTSIPNVQPAPQWTLNAAGDSLITTVTLDASGDGFFYVQSNDNDSIEVDPATGKQENLPFIVELTMLPTDAVYTPMDIENSGLIVDDEPGGTGGGGGGGTTSPITVTPTMTGGTPGSSESTLSFETLPMTSTVIMIEEDVPPAGGTGDTPLPFELVVFRDIAGAGTNLDSEVTLTLTLSSLPGGGRDPQITSSPTPTAVSITFSADPTATQQRAVISLDLVADDLDNMNYRFDAEISITSSANMDATITDSTRSIRVMDNDP